MHRTVRKLSLVTTLIFTLGIILRIAGINSEFWFDEIYSLQLSMRISRAFQIITDLHSDNNHPLTTLWMWLIGVTPHWNIYRIPSLAAGILSLPVFHTLAKRIFKSDSFANNVSLFLFAISFPLFHYATEARGYTEALLFSLLSALACMESIENFSLKPCITNFLFSCLGVLSHYCFIEYYLGAMLWSITIFIHSCGFKKALIRSLQLHLAPCILILGIYILDVQFLNPGSGPIWSYPDAITNTISLIFGGPKISEFSTYSIFTAGTISIFFFLVVFLEITHLARRRDSQALYYLSFLILAPTLVLFVHRPRVLYERYFITVMPVAILLAGHFLSRLFRAGKFGQVLSVLLLVSSFLGSTLHLKYFLAFGRGDYLNAITQIYQSSDSDIYVAGDQVFSQKSIFDFYNQFLPNPQKIRYFALTDQINARLDWYITQTSDLHYAAPAEISVGSIRFLLINNFKYGGLSGVSWNIYRATP